VRRTVLIVLFIFGLLAGSAVKATDDTVATTSPTLTKFQLGGRIGAWSNQGQTPPAKDTAADFETNFNNANVYFEVFGARRILPMTMAEFSFGIVNRGTVAFDVDGRSNIGDVLVYNFLLQLKFYPAALTAWKLQPYVSAGGGLYFGRRTVKLSSSYYSYYGIDEDSQTDLSYVFGGGIDYRLTKSLALDFNVKYMAIDFGNGLMTINDYDALTITAGLKYLTNGLHANK